MPSSPEYPRTSLTEPRAKRFRLGLWKGVWRSTYIDFARMKAKSDAREQQRLVMPSSAGAVSTYNRQALSSVSQRKQLGPARRA